MDVFQSWINGQLVTSEPTRSLDLICPVTESVFGQSHYATKDEVETAVDLSERAQKKWSQCSGTERGRVLKKAANILRKKNSELARLEVLNTGKPLSEAQVVDVHSGADALEYFGGLAASIKGEYYPLDSSFAYTRPEPLGVVLGIGAWNYPLQIACWKSAPALAAGNAMIFKPSELTPVTALKLAEIYKEAGLPDGVFNVLLGDHLVGESLVQHPKIKKVSLTGEDSTGRKVMKEASQNLMQITLELGGKSPFIVFEDADIDQAVQGAIDANFYTQGEICTNGTRVFVQKGIKEQFLKKLVARVSDLVVGDPMDPNTQVGALICSAHFKKVMGFIEKGKSEGAHLVCGGTRVGDKGFFVAPTIFSDCKDEMSIVKDEIFGPVLSLLEFESEEEVVRRANQTKFGLAAGVFTKDLQRGHRVAAGVEAGICWLNAYNLTPVEIPFGGFKQSGIGKENSEWALRHYLQLKTVYVHMDKPN